MSQIIKFPVALGDEVRDRVTGFTGIVVALTEWFNRCQRASVQPPMKADGSIPQSDAFDVEQLEVITAAKVQPKPVAYDTTPAAPARTGGPMPAVSERRRI